MGEAVEEFGDVVVLTAQLRDLAHDGGDSQVDLRQFVVRSHGVSPPRSKTAVRVESETTDVSASSDGQPPGDLASGEVGVAGGGAAE